MDGTVTIYSARDERGNAFYEHCQLITGAGTIMFENGQAKVTPEQALALASNEQIITSRTNGHLEATPVMAPHPALPTGLQDASPAELELAAAAIAAHREGVTAFTSWTSEHIDELATVPEPDAPPPAPAAQETEDDDDEPPEPAPSGTASTEGDESGDPAAPAAADLQLDPSLQAAREHLAAEGEHVPKVLPQGFEAQTGEGEPRCYARKADDSQCSNAAKPAGDHSSYACGLARHIEQVAQLP